MVLHVPTAFAQYCTLFEIQMGKHFKTVVSQVTGHVTNMKFSYFRVTLAFDLPWKWEVGAWKDIILTSLHSSYKVGGKKMDAYVFLFLHAKSQAIL